MYHLNLLVYLYNYHMPTSKSLSKINMESFLMNEAHTEHGQHNVKKIMLEVVC